MMSRTRLYALILAFSGNACAADLLDVFRQAKTADAAYAAARSAWSAAQERIPQARAGLLPLASVSASAQHNERAIRFRDDAVPRSDSSFGSGAVTLSVTQPLYRRQSMLTYEQALTQTQQADAQFALAAQELILRVAQVYFDVLLAQDNVALAEAQRTSIGQQLDQAKRNFEVGTATITDTHEAQSRFDLTTAQEIAARNDLELRRYALAQVIARSAPPLAPLGPRFSLEPPRPATMETWVELARERNLQVHIAQSASNFSNQEIARNRAAHYPTLDAFVTLSNSGSGAGTTGGPGTDTRSSVAGLQLTVPLYQGGLISSRVREAIANQSRALDELEGARRGAEFSARQAFLGITSGIAQVRALEAALVSTQSQLESTRLGQNVGVRTQVDVLNAQQLLFSAQRDLAQSKYTYILSLLRLEGAIGELTEEDLLPVNLWLGGGPSAATASAPAAVALSIPQPAATATDVVPQRPAAVIPAVSPDPGKAATPAVSTAEVLETVNGWARAWSSNDVSRYLAYYAPDFQPPRGLSRNAWAAERTARIQKRRGIEVALETPVVALDGDTATVTFRQQYRAGALHIISDKTLELERAGDRWLIRRETILAETYR